MHAHPDLYPRLDGKVRRQVQDGRFAIGSLDCPGFGASLAPDFEAAEPMPASAWETGEAT